MIVFGVGLLAVSVASLLPLTAPAPTATRPADSASTLDRRITTAQRSLDQRPRNPKLWADLGTAYVEKARITANPVYYQKADGALNRSLDQQPEGNATALIGLGALANARHDFTAARDWGLRAKAVQPDTAEVYGVLADAYTQLGDTDAATGAIQRMLDLKPGVSSFTRAAYDFELHGQVDQARDALERALDDAVDPSDIAFCRYRLGELAYDNGDVDTAEQHYEAGLRAAPQDPPLLQGRAKIAAARGDTTTAIAAYQDLVNRLPTSQYLQEYAALLTAAGKPDLARQQYTLIEQQEQLQAAAGATDDLAASLVAADRGDAAAALARAQAEWARRQPVFAADALAWALHLNGRDAEALTFADRAAALGWHNAAAAYHRGKILAALGRDADAVTALDQALRINPHFSPVGAPDARRTLATLRAAR
ncbi:tetratricopeptide repeat protein [Actinophytocola sp. NPDC049390]|uniref:tetratricopeptide repeat protein n=1 Tax=Actinophytocola sp. NPDC049390 TaxID=3363894 RepID=UPI0037A450D5